MEFHDMAMKAFLDVRKSDPTATMDYESPFMQRARDYGVKRGSIKSEEELTIRQIGHSGEIKEGEKSGLLKLPSPDQGKNGNLLVAAVNSQGSSTEVMLPEQANALALTFNEDVSYGAISKAGALPLGDDSSWVKFAEAKLKRDNAMDHQSLLWELGTELAENSQIQNGGLNVTLENLLLQNLKEWFVKGGGQLHYVDPTISKENGFKLIATEDVNAGDVIVSVPMKLIMCRQTARNVLIQKRGKYLGEELAKTFEKNELWGLAIFLLHEYYKEMTGVGSKWGPFIRTLHMRMLSTEALQGLAGTTAAQLAKQWIKGSDSFMWWTSGHDGPCTPTTGICTTKPKDKHGDSRFNIHQMRWAYFVVKQNAVKIKHIATGLEFVALVPFYNMFDKEMGKGGGVSFELDGSISVRAGAAKAEGSGVGLHPGNLTDPEFFMRYLHTPKEHNPFNFVKLSLPGAIPKGSKFHYCMKGTAKEQRKDECKGAFKSESMFWKSKVLGEWRQMMNLPPRLQELRMWATRLHLYGTDEEMKLMSAANQMIAGLPIPVDQMPAEEQLMLMGVANSNAEAQAMVAGSAAERPPPQLYSAPDPTEDPEAQRAMEHLATLAVQAQNVMASNNLMLNATRAVLNHTRDFFLHGVLPMAGLDELDYFLLKKIGMLAHCGFENDMKISPGNITDELLCAMRVHLMNETEMNIFCPADAKPWEENCHSVEFSNFTAISENNEASVIQALRSSVIGMLSSFPHTIEQDRELLRDNEAGVGEGLGVVTVGAIQLRMREKELMLSALQFLADLEQKMTNGTVVFQLEMKTRERAEADVKEAERKLFMEEVKRRAAYRAPLAVLEVNLGAGNIVNLTLEEGASLQDTVALFCRKHNVGNANIDTLTKALKLRVSSPKPLALLMGVVVPSGERKILSVPEGADSAVETSVFCAKHDITDTKPCDLLLDRVRARLNVSSAFSRRVLVVLPLDAPDSRKLQLVVREGEQHDLRQLSADFFELYHMPLASVDVVAEELHKRLPPVALQIPIGITAKRQVVIRFSLNDNITTVVDAFTNYFEIDEATRLAIAKRARVGMAPGTYLI